MRQLPLKLAHQSALGRDDFIVGRANREVIDLIDRWPAWPERGVLLVGPPGSGKSHLGAIWAVASEGVRIAAKELAEADVEPLATAAAVSVEDLHDGPVDERALFHLLNALAERRIPIFVTSRRGVAALGLAVPDLVSRLRALQLTTLHEPDDDLLRQVLHGLLENAIRYAKSRITLTCRTENSHAVLDIRNDRESSTIATSGLGLGLRLVRGICKACGTEFETRQDDHDFHATIRIPMFGKPNDMHTP